ncbi:MAG TPA: hypothetical protein VMR50_08650 [Myxococcota bacterium]|nr:hypothetical protein [Myxococcota bacterium]
MNRRWLRGLLILGALALLGVWLAPWLMLRFALPGMAERAGGTIEVSGALPALPFGMQASHLKISRDGRVLDIDDFRAVLLPSGPRLDARIADGTLLVRGDDAQLKDGFVRLDGISLESLAVLSTEPMGVKGRCDGVWHFGRDTRFEGTVTRGAFVAQQPAPIQVPFEQLVVSAARDPDAGDWQLKTFDIQGPQITGHAAGKIGADGKLAIDIDIRDLQEPLRGFLAMSHVPTEPLPLALALRGTTALPQLVSRTETAPPPER